MKVLKQNLRYYWAIRPITKCDKLGELLEEVKTNRIMIPPHFTSCVLPCDVGINKYLKDRLENAMSN